MSWAAAHGFGCQQDSCIAAPADHKNRAAAPQQFLWCDLVVIAKAICECHNHVACALLYAGPTISAAGGTPRAGGGISTEAPDHIWLSQDVSSCLEGLSSLSTSEPAHLRCARRGGQDLLDDCSGAFP